MTNHPNRSGRKNVPGANPKPADLIELRERYGISQREAAALAYSSERSWQNWESGERRMHPAIWAWVLHVSEEKAKAGDFDPPEILDTGI
jgi:DNA-binding transcriptional regulator YiaG